MKRIIIAIVVIIVILGLIGFLYAQGHFRNMRWETLTMIFAALAAPFQGIANWLRGGSEQDDMAKKKADFELLVKQQEEKRQFIQADIKANEDKARKLEMDMELMKANLAVMEEKQKRAKVDIMKLSTSEADQRLDKLLE